MATRILSIGVSHQRLEQVPLRFAEADALAVHHLLSETWGASADDQCLLLSDDATADNTHAALYGTLARRARPGDTVFIYFSGHGALDPRGHTGYLITRTARGARPGINLRELRSLVEDTMASTVIVILDACHSGAIGQEKHALSSRALMISSLGMDTVTATKVFLASSASSAISKEIPAYQHSAFTYHLLSIAREPRAGALTLSTLFDRVSGAQEASGGPAPIKAGIEVGRAVFLPKDAPARRAAATPDSPRSMIPRWLEERREERRPFPLKDDQSRFVRDENYPDGSLVPVSAVITKSWIIQNCGKVAWKGRFMRCVGADRGTGLASVPVMTPIPDTEPGEEVRISIPMQMPSYPGAVHVTFKMVDISGAPCFPELRGIYAVLNVFDR